MLIRTGDDLISVREAARICGRNMETIRRWVWAGKLPAEKLGNQLFIKKSELDAYRRKLAASKQEVARKSDFLERAMRLQNRIRARTGAEFDVAALIRESRHTQTV